MDILTIEALLAASERDVVLPLLSAQLGTEQRVRVRRISGAEHFSCFPPEPPDSATWPEQEYAQRAREWYASRSPEVREARRKQARETSYHIVALACLAPELTIDQARRLGDDATVIAAEVLRFSGLIGSRQATPADASGAVAADAPADAA